MLRITKTALLALALSTSATMAVAYEAINDKTEFLTALGDYNLSNRLYGVNLSVEPNGQIAGSGAGWDITGSWTWENGYFCRDLTWGGDPLPYNCQLVEYNGEEMRFTTDQGAGESASFRLR